MADRKMMTGRRIDWQAGFTGLRGSALVKAATPWRLARALIRCFLSLRAVRFPLICGVDYVVPRHRKFRPNRLIQQAILAGEPGILGCDIAIYVVFRTAMVG
jgi:hypothetical protein